MSEIGTNRFDDLVKKFLAQGLTEPQARARARSATAPRLTPPPGVKQQPNGL